MLALKPLPLPAATDLVTARHRLELSQTSAAKLIGISQGAWAQYETGRSRMTAAAWYAFRVRARLLVIRRIAAAYAPAAMPAELRADLTAKLNEALENE